MATKKKIVTEAPVEVEAVAEVKEESPKYGEVNCPRLNIREKADIASGIEAVITVGDNVQITEVVGDWFGVKLPNGIEGYTMRKFISTK